MSKSTNLRRNATVKATAVQPQKGKLVAPKKSNPSQQRAVQVQQQYAPHGNGQTQQRQKQPKYQGKYDNAGREWWNLTGDVLFDLGSKAILYGTKALTGFGDYHVDTNSLLASATNGHNGATVPIMRNSKVANIIRHREYIGDVMGSTSPFSARTYDLNPGQDSTFPFLSPIAKCYTNYRMRGAVMHFVSLATDYSAVPYIGYVAMGTQYNSLAPEFTDKKTLENSEFSNSCKPSNDLSHPIECATDQLALSELYIRGGLVPDGADKRLYDMGRFTIAVGGQAAETIIGELWCTYEVELFFPKLATTSGSLTQLYFSRSLNGGNLFPLKGLDVAGTEGSTFTVSYYHPPSSGAANPRQALMFSRDTIGQKFLVVISWSGTPSVSPWLTPSVVGVNSTVTTLQITPVHGTSSVILTTITFLCHIDKGVQGGFNIDVDSTPISLPVSTGVRDPQSYVLISQVPLDFNMNQPS